MYLYSTPIRMCALAVVFVVTNIVGQFSCLVILVPICNVFERVRRNVCVFKDLYTAAHLLVGDCVLQGNSFHFFEYACQFIVDSHRLRIGYIKFTYNLLYEYMIEKFDLNSTRVPRQSSMPTSFLIFILYIHIHVIPLGSIVFK